MNSLTPKVLLATIAVATQPLAADAGMASGPSDAGRRLPESRLWDETRQLSPREHVLVEARLTDADRRLGAPVFVLVVGHLNRETAATRAARAFRERLAGLPAGTDRILLLLSPRDHEAAIETGMGNAGLVPEIDARRIAARLVSRRTAGSSGHALVEAVAAIVDSVEATRERRTPLPAGDADADADPRAAPEGSGLRAAPEAQGAPTAARDAGIADAGEAPASVPTPGGRSKLPLAAVIAGLLLLALALRRRRQMAATRPPPPRDPSAR